MPLHAANGSWTTKAEAAVLALRDIQGVSIQTEGDEVKEVHILTTSDRPAKQIVRDVQTLLLTRFNRSIDHRVVSVAFSEAEPKVNARSQASSAPESTPATETERRIRFVSANLYVSGPRVQAQVELRCRNVPRMGSASGTSTRDGAHRLIVAATIAAVQDYLEEDMAVGLEGLEIIPVGRGQVAVVALELLAHREHKNLVGCCAVDQDVQQAVVLATLAALNRVISGLQNK